LSDYKQKVVCEQQSF